MGASTSTESLASADGPPDSVIAVVAPSTTAPRPTHVDTTHKTPVAVGPLEPITGYGDFSHVATPYDLDPDEVMMAVAACLQDNGYPVIFTPGMGVDWSPIPPHQHMEGSRVEDACFTGLNLPDPVPPTEQQLLDRYDYLVEMAACLAAEGYDTPDPPSPEAFVEGYGTEESWSPYNFLPLSLSEEEWQRLMVACPQA
jgi:hypothetical protein